MFRFVDVLASLRRSGDIVQHLDEYFARHAQRLHPDAADRRARGRIVPWLTRWSCAGTFPGWRGSSSPAETGSDVLKTLRKGESKRSVSPSILLGEAVVSEQEADEYAARCHGVARDAFARNAGLERSVRQKHGAFPGGESFGKNLRALFADESGRPGRGDRASRAEAAADPAPRARRSARSSISTWKATRTKTPRSSFSRRSSPSRNFADWPHAGIVIQAYLRDAEARPARPDRMGPAARHALRGPPRERRLLGLREDQSGAERLALPGLSAEAGERRELRSLHAHSARKRIDRHRGVRFPQRPQHRARHGLRGVSSASTGAVSNFSCSTEWPVRSSARSSRWVIACANIRPVGELLPGMSYLVRRLARKHFQRRFPDAPNFPISFRPRSYCAIRELSSIRARTTSSRQSTMAASQ